MPVKLHPRFLFLLFGGIILNAYSFSYWQDTIKRIPVKMYAKEIPLYYKPFKESEPMAETTAEYAVPKKKHTVFAPDHGTNQKQVKQPVIKKAKRNISKHSRYSSQLSKNIADSKRSYLRIGIVLIVIGLIFGWVFGRPGYLVCVVGIVFMMIGLFIR